MKHLCVLCMLAVLLVLSVSAVRAGEVTPPTPSMPAGSVSAATGTIAYVVPNDTTGDQVWLTESNGTNTRPLYSLGVADPEQIRAISGLAWRPDGGELVFASDHESYCSWYASDLYAIMPNGSGYRRVTNGPACAALANYPKGSVTMTLPSGGYVYLKGMSQAFFSSGGTITVNNVADLGDGVQETVAIYLGKRMMGDPIDVRAGQTVNAGIVSFYPPWTWDIGAWGPSWRRDGSKIAYSFGCAALYEIADQPPAGSSGEELLNIAGVTPCGVVYGPTASTASDIVYFTRTGGTGIYRTTEHSSSMGTQLVATNEYDILFALAYLPDASGIIFTITDNYSESSNIYRYTFATDAVTQLTNFTNEYARDFAISPDGQTIVFERAQPEYLAPYGGPSDLWMMGINGSNLQLFKTNAAHPAWKTGVVQPPVVEQPVKVYLPLVKR